MSTDWTESAWRTQARIPAEATLPETSRRIAEYELVKLMGRGEFAEVYLCRELGRDELHAAKRINKARVYADSDIRKQIRSIKRINTEIEAMRALDHAMICRLFGAYHTRKYVYLVMERGGPDLYDVLSTHRDAFTPPTILEIARHVSGALAHCSERGVVHRDLKPENVLVDGLERSGDSDAPGGRRLPLTVKLCDFGLCGRRKAGGSWELSDFVGSPGFFAPEILFDDLYDAEKVDVWSLGCVVLEMLEGHDGFEQIWLNRCYSSSLLHNAANFGAALDRAVAELADRESLRDPSIRDLVTRLLVIDVDARDSPTDLPRAACFRGRGDGGRGGATTPTRNEPRSFFRDGVADASDKERRTPFSNTPTIEGRSLAPVPSATLTTPRLPRHDERRPSTEGRDRAPTPTHASSALPAIALTPAPKASPKPPRSKPAKAKAAVSTEAEDSNDSNDATSPDSVHSPIPHTTAAKNRLKPTAPGAMHIPPFRGGPARTYVEAEPDK